MKRRTFVNVSATAIGAGTIAGLSSCTPSNENSNDQSVLANLESMTQDISPIGVNERKERIAKAQRLLNQENIQALILDAGTSMKYFTGISWGTSERPMVAIIPANGEVSYVCPGFEESRLKELIKLGKEVFVWEEDESPYKQIVNALEDSNVTSGKIGIEEQLRFFILNGIKKEAPHFDFVSGDPVTIPCRLFKSDSELALMRKANDITRKAMSIGIESLREGMTPGGFSKVVAEAHNQLGAQHTFAGVNFGEASAFPHGSSKPQYLKKGDIVLMDCGCRVDGYCSDISRTIVFGASPTKRQQEIWDLEKKAQMAGFAAIKIGATCGSVDDAARKVLTDAGLGPDYKLPGLPHRTGHGIGMDVHEWGNIVRGNQRKLEAGMCFSVEPNISIVGEFGIRHEDCVYMTESGPEWFSEPCQSIDKPFG